MENPKKEPKFLNYAKGDGSHHEVLKGGSTEYNFFHYVYVLI